MRIKRKELLFLHNVFNWVHCHLVFGSKLSSWLQWISSSGSNNMSDGSNGLWTYPLTLLLAMWGHGHILGTFSSLKTAFLTFLWTCKFWHCVEGHGAAPPPIGVGPQQGSCSFCIRLPTYSWHNPRLLWKWPSPPLINWIHSQGWRKSTALSYCTPCLVQRNLRVSFKMLTAEQKIPALQNNK